MTVSELKGLKVGDRIFYKAIGRLESGIVESINVEKIERWSHVILKDVPFFDRVYFRNIVDVGETKWIDKLDTTFYDTLSISPWDSKEKECEIQWDDDKPWETATAEYDYDNNVILVKDMKKKECYVYTDGTCYGTHPKIRRYNDDGKDHSWEWLTTAPNPKSPATGHDAGQRGWRIHLVDVVDDKPHGPSLCGIRPPHGWNVDFFIDTKCSRCVSKAEKLGLIKNVVRVSGHIMRVEYAENSKISDIY